MVENKVLAVRIGGPYYFSQFSTKMPATDPTQSLSVSVIQTETPQLKKLNRMHWPAIKATILDQITTAKGALVVTPETIIPTSLYPSSFTQTLQNISNNTNQSILFGSQLNNSTGIYNSAILLSPNTAPTV